jgi:hypothetical protein
LMESSRPMLSSVQKRCETRKERRDSAFNGK